MTWARFDDQYFRHPKIVAAGRDARDLHIASILYATSGLTDGFVPAAALRMVAAEADIDGAATAAERLVSAGLWESVAGGWQIHDFLDYQQSAAQVRANRAVRAEAGARGGIRSGASRRSKREANAKQNALSVASAGLEANAKQNRTPNPNPNPYQILDPSANGASYRGAGAFIEHPEVPAQPRKRGGAPTLRPDLESLVVTLLGKPLLVKQRKQLAYHDGLDPPPTEAQYRAAIGRALANASGDPIAYAMTFVHELDPETNHGLTRGRNGTTPGGAGPHSAPRATTDVAGSWERHPP